MACLASMPQLSVSTAIITKGKWNTCSFQRLIKKFFRNRPMFIFNVLTWFHGKFFCKLKDTMRVLHDNSWKINGIWYRFYFFIIMIIKIWVITCNSTITPLHSHSNCQTYLYRSVKILERRSNAELWKMARRLIEYIVLMS